MNFEIKQKDLAKKRETLQALIKELDMRFKSGNDVEVKDIRMTREEWKILREEARTSVEDFALLEKIYA